MLTLQKRPTDYFDEALWKRDLLRQAGLEYEPDAFDLLASILGIKKELAALLQQHGHESSKTSSPNAEN